MKINKIPELVLPGGDMQRVQTAFRYGADAVYVGLSEYSLRKAEVRFSIAGIGKAIKFAHDQKKKLYVTFNIFAHNEHLDGVAKDMKAVAKFGPDAFIISDPGIIAIAQKVAPEIPIHLSTQANTINSATVKFWQNQGLKRIVLGREATLTEIKEIKKAVPAMELEIFVHGAMCISYSGRCLLSSYMTGRSANLGQCAQPCRWRYAIYSDKPVRPESPVTSDQDKTHFFLEEGKRKGEFLELSEDEKGTYLMSSKDLCLIEYIEEIAAAGVSALKIEGRNKTDFYVATTARAYRKALDSMADGEFTPKAKRELRLELNSLTRRDYTSGFLFGAAKSGETFNSRELMAGKKYLGKVVSVTRDGTASVIVKNKIQKGKKYELLTPDEITSFCVLKILDENKKPVTEVNPGKTGQIAYLKTDRIIASDTFIREPN